MAASVIDTRGEFKLVPYSGDDEQWPQWVLKFEAWSELVGWGRQLDAASQLHSSNHEHDSGGRCSNDLKTTVRNPRGKT